MPEWTDLSLGTPGRLDDDAALILAKAAEMNLPPLWSMTPVEARAEYRRRLERSNPPAPEGVETEDTAIAGPAGPIPLRLYRPAGRPARGALLYLHGGGLVVGDIEAYDPVCRVIAAETGSLVASADYRLGPEHPYPAAVEDGVAALRRLAAQGFAGPLAVAGDSGGGTLAAVAARHARDEGIPLALQILIYPAVDQGGDFPSRRRLAEGHLLTETDIRWFQDQYFIGRAQPVLEPDASPLRAPDLSALAPALVLTCGFDPLADEGKAYARALRGAGVPTRSVCLEGGIHGCVSLAGYLACGRAALAEVCRCWSETITQNPDSGH